MKTNQDIDFAELNHIEMENGNVVSMKSESGLCSKLLKSPDFVVTQSPYSVWEVTSDTHDWRTYCESFVCILRANQSSLTGALRYMTSENRVLIWNKQIEEK